MSFLKWLTEVPQDYKERQENRERYLKGLTDDQLIIAALLDLNSAGLFTEKAIGTELWKRLPSKVNS